MLIILMNSGLVKHVHMWHLFSLVWSRLLKPGEEQEVTHVHLGSASGFPLQIMYDTLAIIITNFSST